jgi:hypothetical protein
MTKSTTARPGRPKKAQLDTIPLMNVRTNYSTDAHEALLEEQRRRFKLTHIKVPVADIQREWLEEAAARAKAGPALSVAA